jgi:RecB family exonuclease
VLEARLLWERLPLDALPQGAVHVGALDAIAGLPFRLLAIVGLVEGGYPGVVRPDPFLLDDERTALDALVRRAQPPDPPAAPAEQPRPAGQLSLFDAPQADAPAAAPGDDDEPPALPGTPEIVLAERRRFQRAVRQAGQRLVLTYPRADARTGRERLPSLFFVATASALHGRALSADELQARVAEDDLDRLSPDEALDRGERDRLRLRAGRQEAAEAVAAGSVFFKRSLLASEARWSPEFTRWDGLVDGLPTGLAERLDPTRAARPLSASQLATWSRCGFLYLLRYVLLLEPALEPEERKRLEPLERGTLFHAVAERFLRERRERDELPVEATPERRARLRELADAALQELVEGSPPRFQLLWERACARFHETVQAWLGRETGLGQNSRPAHFEVAFGSTRDLAPGEPHLHEPLEIELGDGRRVRVSGRIDRIDRRDDGLVLRDYKTGRAPKDDGRVFRGGQQLQIPFYVLAVERLFPGEKVVEAFLDYVDGGRQVAFDPALAGGPVFRDLLRGLADALAAGRFPQEPAACDWCDFTLVCGPKPLLQRRRQIKRRDAHLREVTRLRDLG